jgi:hypothetical protein
VQKRAEEANRKKIETEKKRASLHRKVHKILEKKGEGYEMWSKIELGTMLQYHKIQKDPAVWPKTCLVNVNNGLDEGSERLCD